MAIVVRDVHEHLREPGVEPLVEFFKRTARLDERNVMKREFVFVCGRRPFGRSKTPTVYIIRQFQHSFDLQRRSATLYAVQNRPSTHHARMAKKQRDHFLRKKWSR